MGRHSGRGFLQLLLPVALLLVSAAPAAPRAAPAAASAPAPAPVAAASRNSYPSYEEILPLWMSLLRMKEAMVYRVGKPKDLRLLDEGRDSVGSIAGSPILASARVGSGGDWLDSLRSIVGKPTSYRRDEQMQLVPPEVVIRLRGEDDSMTVMIGAKGSFLYVTPSEGPVIAGWIDRDRAKLAALVEKAFRPRRTSRPRAKK